MNLEIKEDAKEITDQLHVIDQENFQSLTDIMKNVYTENLDFKKAVEQNQQLQNEFSQLKKRKRKTALNRQRDKKMGLENKATQLRHSLNHIRYEIEHIQKKINNVNNNIDQYKIEQKPYLTEKDSRTKRIRLLENRLDKVIVQYNEAKHVHMTYNQIEKKLKKENISFDKRIKHLERSLQESNRIFQRFNKEFLEAIKVRDDKHQELRNLQFEMNSRRKRSRKLLKQEKDRIRNRIRKTIKKTNKIQKDRLKLSKTQPIEDNSLNHNSSNNSLSLIDGNIDEELEATRQEWYDIKQATGTKDCDTLYQKFLSLAENEKEFMEKLETIKKEEQRLQLNLNEINEKLDRYNSKKVKNYERRKILDTFVQQENKLSQRFESLSKKSDDLKRKKTQIEVSVHYLCTILGIDDKDLNFKDVLYLIIQEYEKKKLNNDEVEFSSEYNKRICFDGEEMEEIEDDLIINDHVDVVVLDRKKVKDYSLIEVAKKKKNFWKKIEEGICTKTQPNYCKYE